MKTNRNLEDIRRNTVNDCYYCTNDGKDCVYVYGGINYDTRRKVFEDN